MVRLRLNVRHMNIEIFKKNIWTYYQKHKRNLIWRRTRDPYKILVSEVMLQQTQSYRVEPKYKAFITKFPTVMSLAQASIADVLQEWQGLGYNRRALYLKRCAEKISKDFKGKFPKNAEQLLSLPGVGKATAGDVLAFAWNIPTVFIETNIRSVFIHFFFKDIEKVSDKEILQLVEQTLDKKNPREWYWALFDYGSMLKKKINLNNKSTHYIKQTKFIGSFRQKRSLVLRFILKKACTKKDVEMMLGNDVVMSARIIASLEKDGFIKNKRDVLEILR